MYHEQIQFLVIYIREAHPMDGRRPGKDHGIYDPTTIEERRGLAVRCEAAMAHGIQTYVDEMDDPVSKAYAAKPTRLYLVGLDGLVTYAGSNSDYIKSSIA